MAVAALSAVAVLDVGSPTAEAAPSASRFAGTYGWDWWPAPITIADGGQITSSYSGNERYKGSISGRVSDDGSYSFTLSQTYYVEPIDTERRALVDPVAGPVYRSRGRWVTERNDYVGSMALDAVGNIVGTVVPDNRDPNGSSFTWLRQ
jgi:hypothetical protein